jgi:hypothetical protein
MNAALFWFWKGNDITDAAAFEALQEGNIDSAINIWTKLTEKREVTKQNASAFQNLSTLVLLDASDTSKLKQGASLKLKFLESDFVRDIKTIVADKTFKITSKDLQLTFLSMLLAEMEKKNKEALLFKILKELEFQAKQDFAKDIAQKYTANITAQIEIARKRRKENNADGAKAGENLYNQTKDDLEKLKFIFGIGNLNYSNIADKVANEILQCSIDFFNYYYEYSNTDIGNEALALAKKTQSLAVGNITKQRCEENIETIQKWVNDKPNREKQKRIKSDFDFIAEQLRLFQTQFNTVDNAKNLAVSCKPKLDNIKMILGSYDDVYIKLSSAVVANTQEMLVAIVNKSQENIQTQIHVTAMINLTFIIKEALNVINLLESFDMNSSLRNQYNNNKRILQTMYNELNTGSKQSSSSDGNCYIATVAYGSYEHPQVTVLRQFRDNVLDKYILGKWFIKIYYRYSPELAKKLKDKKTANTIIRKILNMLIKIIKTS